MQWQQEEEKVYEAFRELDANGERNKHLVAAAESNLQGEMQCGMEKQFSMTLKRR